MNSDKNRKLEIDDRAAEWVLKNDRGLSAAEQDTFTEWLSESAEHREAYAAHRFAWAELARLAGLQNTDYAPVVPDLLGMEKSPWYAKTRNFPMWRTTLAIAATLLFFMGYFMVDHLRDQQTFHSANPSIVLNQIKQQVLEDGSVIDLNKGAVTEIHYSREQRLVKLISGEANFNVEKDPSRPFVVETSGIRLRALGTVFNVRLADRAVDVVVTEGTVAIESQQVTSGSGNFAMAESLVGRNFRAIVDLRPEIPQVSVDPVDEKGLDAELLWQPRLIDFENAPLSQIVDEFNRRNPVKLEIHDESIGSLRFTSIFWSHNVESFVRLLAANYGITTEVISENQILLKKSPAAL